MRVALAAAALLWALAFGLAGQARAVDLNVALSEAEASVASSEADVAQAEAELAPARARYETSVRRAAPADRAAASAQRQTRRTKAGLVAARQQAQGRIAAIEADHAQAVEDHDEEVRAWIAFGLAALVAAAIALGWGLIRDSGPAAWLADRPTGQVVGLSVFGGILALIVGGVMFGADGVVGVIGGLLALLAFVLPSAVLLARHSASVRAGKSKPLTGRERLPEWVPQAVAGVAAALFLVGMGSAVFAGEPQEVAVPARLASAAAPSALAGPALARAERRAAALGRRAARLDAVRAAARREVEGPRGRLHRAEQRLASAKRDVDHYETRIAVLIEREHRKIEEEERLAAKAEEEELATEGPECDPNYVGACLDPNASDYDCAGGSGNGPEYTGPVQVVGVDHYGLDADGDGYACEE